MLSYQISSKIVWWAKIKTSLSWNVNVNETFHNLIILEKGAFFSIFMDAGVKIKELQSYC